MKFWPLKSSLTRACSIVSRLIVILAALICLQQQCQAQQPSASKADGGSGTVVGWTYCGLAVCLLAGGAAVVVWRTKTHRRQTRPPIWAALFTNKPPISTASSKSSSVAPKNGKSNGYIKPKLVSNRGHGPKPFHRRRRKRIFDYSKFYTKVMRELSPHTYSPSSTTNGNSKSNGHGNHNGHTHVQSNGHANPNGQNTNQTIKSEMEDLIIVQKNMIQEQKRLLDEQTRLIEEKRWLIKEQAAFLKTQSGLAADQQPSRLKI